MVLKDNYMLNMRTVTHTHTHTQCSIADPNVSILEMLLSFRI